MLRRWRLVGWAALGLAVMAALTLLLAGTGEDGVRTLVRATARSSLSLFLLAFSASNLCRLWPSPQTTWLLRNRRYIGVSFALSHFLHLAALVVLALAWPHPFLEQSATPVTLVGGGLAYVFIAAMTATSFDRSAAWLGSRRWRLLHTVGSYYVWGIFALGYVGRALVSPAYVPPALAVTGALVLRAASRLRSARPVSATDRSLS